MDTTHDVSEFDLTFVSVLKIEINNLSDRVGQLDNQIQAQKLMQATGSGDPNAIVKALEDITLNIKNDCKLLYCPINDFSLLKLKVDDDLLKRIAALEAQTKEANRHIDKLKEELKNQLQMIDGSKKK